MDVLRTGAEQLLQDLPNESAEEYKVIHIKSSRTDYANVTFEYKTLGNMELQGFIDDSPSSPNIISTKIVRIHYHPDRNQVSFFRIPEYMAFVSSGSVHDVFVPPQCARILPILLHINRSPTVKFYVNCQAHWLL